MTLLYFSWLREKIGHRSEHIGLPEGVTTVGDLIAWLKRRGPGYAAALEDLSVVRVAVNQDFVSLDHPIADGDEIALFPPVTGG